MSTEGSPTRKLNVDVITWNFPEPAAPNQLAQQPRPVVMTVHERFHQEPVTLPGVLEQGLALLARDGERLLA